MSASRLLWLRRLAIAAVVALALSYVPYSLYGSSGLARYLKLQRERDQLHEGNRKLADANLKLRAELGALSDGNPAGAPPRAEGQPSLAAVERVARDELGLIRPGEVVFELEGATAPERGARP
jgi:cell division protein FtsB